MGLDKTNTVGFNSSVGVQETDFLIVTVFSVFFYQ